MRRDSVMSRLRADPVDHPAHYQGDGIEVIQVIEAFGLGFRLGNAVKYILRAGKKGQAIQDLRKAVWYLEREITASARLPAPSGTDNIGSA